MQRPLDSFNLGNAFRMKGVVFEVNCILVCHKMANDKICFF